MKKIDINDELILLNKVGSVKSAKAATYIDDDFEYDGEEKKYDISFEEDYPYSMPDDVFISLMEDREREIEEEINREFIEKSEKEIDSNSVDWEKRYNEIIPFTEKISFVRRIDEYLALDYNLGTLIENSPTYKNVLVLNPNVAIVKNIKGFGLINSKLNTIIPCVPPPNSVAI